ncbi:hypothetical protein HK103_005589 [Boothiomyces macroporosus]|uniref:Uncharacterized protein n=1 Tax=Boothiomyces macroporosus TaxID=261099 RepID=A0AAD5UFP5_9FUNG|nr:hypothetical protein HK103_005589 [Boothiomyces macroporosus]
MAEEKEIQETYLEVEETETPRSSRELARGETKAIQRKKKKIKNETGYKFHEFKVAGGSVIDDIYIPVLVYTAWAAIWTVIYQQTKISIALQPIVITLLSTVLGLLLVFRTNTSYDRYWEARRLWSTLFTHSRNLSRLIWYDVDAAGDRKKVAEKFGAVNLVVAFAVACKHYLRGEKGFHYEDLHNLLIHVPDFKPGQYHPETDSLPLEITFHLASYFKRTRKEGMVDAVAGGQMIIALNGLTDSLSSFERIVFSPVPIAYNIHLKQIIMFYLLLLPFQIFSTGYSAIFITFLAAFCLLGIEAIGSEIENPFGYDHNDLDLQGFCEELKAEMAQLCERPTALESTAWSLPAELSDLTKLKSFANRK